MKGFIPIKYFFLIFSIEKNRTIKQDMQIAIHKFNSKPKNGIQFLISNGYLTENKFPNYINKIIFFF